MVKPLSLCGLLILSFTTCEGPKDKQENSLIKGPSSFESDYDTLQTLELPLTLNRDAWSELAERHYDKFGVKGGYDLLTMPFGKLIDSQLFKGIIFVYDNPILITINQNQNPIDTLFLLGDDYSNDPSTRTIEQAKISSDLTIQLIDSVYSYEIGEDESRIDSTEKLTIITKLFRIEKTGQISKVD